MKEKRTIFDPTPGKSPKIHERNQRPKDLIGSTIGLLDISKPRGDVFLNHLEILLKEIGIKVRRYSKPTFTKPAPVDLRYEIASQCDAVIEALAD
tara:strand:+ start:257 stop:541 length:285 start_codon:yes stop_codon:yes gene_type:complete